ncbi:hypothetical protein BD293_3038 [Roseinatronobacter monicus]|uniref:Uncharacterized protein n=1 Tax=Roseinatronobacter monicus TaxID=393481 RepID=A0A543KH29_9RHOB|nr:hypothetical protein BD293_3038 [Roseinatronobacter monicus]
MSFIAVSVSVAKADRSVCTDTEFRQIPAPLTVQPPFSARRAGRSLEAAGTGEKNHSCFIIILCAVVNTTTRITGILDG